ncbi:PadR family transcriptional regulator [Arthrobacter sp. HLT1-20]
MVRETPLTPLGVAALGLLVERPMHPYEMYQLLMQRHEDRLVKIRPGTLYHTVGRLAAAGMVEPTGTDRDGNRPERTTYAVLPQGKKALESRIKELLSTPVNEYPCFPQALGEAHNLPPGVVLELLQTRLTALEAGLAVLNADAALATSRGVARKYWIDVGYQQHLLRAEIDWVGGLRANITDGTIPW